MPHPRLLYGDTGMNSFIQAIRKGVNKRSREAVPISHRIEHRDRVFFCDLFGFDLANCLALDSVGGSRSLRGTEENHSVGRKKLDEGWRRSEAPYRDSCIKTGSLSKPKRHHFGTQ